MTDNTYILDYLIANSANVAFVAVNQNDNIIKFACAFANDKGGAIVLGMDDQNHYTGISSEEYQEAIHDLSTAISPKLPFTASSVIKDNKQLMIISVWEGNDKPYTAQGYFYIRLGEEITIASPSEMSKLFQERERHETSWERQPIEYATTEDLSPMAYTKLHDAKINNDFLPPNTSQEQILKMMGLLNDGRITNAGITVLGKNPSQYLSQAKIRVTLYDGELNLIDLRLYDNNMIEAVDELVAYVSNLYPKNLTFNGITREESETLPILAIREGILNAVVHRAYESHQSFMSVNIYSDRLEIVNSGELPAGISIDDLKREHLSILRNPDIANAFYTIKYIEMAGSGTLRILSECRKAHCDTPIWSSENGMVRLTFPNVRHLANKQNNPKNGKFKLSEDDQIQESLDKIIMYMSQGNSIKHADAVTITGKSYPTVKRYMQILKDAGIVEYIGNNRSGRWQLVGNLPSEVKKGRIP